MIRLRFRRLTAILLCSGLLLSGAEAGIADVHDGDASAEELASAGALACGAVPLGDHDESNEDAGHAAHVCHAGHAHVIIVARRAEAPAITQPVHTVSVKEPESLSGLTISPEVRPPIA